MTAAGRDLYSCCQCGAPVRPHARAIEHGWPSWCLSCDPTITPCPKCGRPTDCGEHKRCRAGRVPAPALTVADQLDIAGLAA